jgi:DNA-binding FrmR family transcriptional regulator
MLLSRVRTLNGRLETIGLAIKQGSGTPDLLPLIVGARHALNSLGREIVEHSVKRQLKRFPLKMNRDDKGAGRLSASS